MEKPRLKDEDMRIGMVLNTNDPETVWNALRLAIATIERNHSVKVFLLGEGVEIENLHNSKFNITKETVVFKEKGGEILACGTCLHIRGRGEMGICPISTMGQLAKIVEESDKIITFG